MVDLHGGDLPDLSLDKEVQVREEDEGRSERGSGVVLHDQVVTLELPVGVVAFLDF